MMVRSPLFAQLEGLNPLNPTAPISKGSGMVFKDVVLIIMIGLALGLILLLFTRIYMRKSKERRHERQTDPPRTVLHEDDEEEGHPGRRRRHRRRRHRRDHRLRNPTLAETGGLPPPKPPEPSNPPL